MNTLESLKNDFKSLGISESDTVFIRGDLGKVGRIEGKKRELFLQSLQEVIGKNGTIVSLGFTKAFPFYRVDKSFVFDSESLPITGALGKLFLNTPATFATALAPSFEDTISVNRIKSLKLHLSFS